MSLRKDLVTASIAMLVLVVFCGLLYPLLITGIGQVAFPGNANGQKVYVGGKLVGSKIIGQSFALAAKGGVPQVNSSCEPIGDPSYFQTRPSGTLECTTKAPITVSNPPDNDAGTEFANYGPNSKVTEAALKANIAAYIQLNGKYYPGGLTAGKVPVDAADTSASAVDPDISVANADIQAYRIAKVRHLSLSEVDALVSKYTAGRGLGFSGEPSVNVLELNLALDRL